MVNIRPLTEQDATSFQYLRLRALQEETDAFGGSYEEFKLRPLSTSVERIRHHTNFPERFVLGAFVQADQLIGNVGLMREQGSKKSHKALIWGMYVAPEVRVKVSAKCSCKN